VSGVQEPAAFVFPAHMRRSDAQRLLQEAYASIDEGKLLRRTNKTLRRAGIDPPIDVQYVAEPAVRMFADGLGITLGCDILIHEEFPELEDCVEAFEASLQELLMDRLEKAVKAWGKRNPAADYS
jgi:hypothetical protein